MKIFISSTDGGKTAEEVLKKYPWLKKRDNIGIEKYHDEYSYNTIQRLCVEGDEKHIFQIMEDISKQIKMDEFVLKFDRHTNKCTEIEIYDYWRE